MKGVSSKTINELIDEFEKGTMTLDDVLNWLSKKDINLTISSHPSGTIVVDAFVGGDYVGASVKDGVTQYLNGLKDRNI